VETTPSAGSRPPGRLRRYARYQLLVAAWLTAAGVAGAAGSVLPHARWVVVHLLLLGAVSSAVMIWSTHFATTLLRAPDPPGSNGFRARLGGLNAGALVVVLGVAGDRGPVVALGAVLVGASAAAHAGALVAAARRALPSRFVLVVRYYVAAALLLPVGAWLGYLLTRPGIGDDLTARLRLAHEAVNLLGWIGLTVAGTLVTFWPTVLRTRLPDGSQRAARRALPLLLLGIGLIAAPAAAGLRPPVALTGVGGYDAGLILLAGPWVAALRQRPPRSMAAWSLLAGTGWWLLTLAGLAVVLATAPGWPAVDARLDALTAPLAVGWVLQTLLGALSFLVPVLIGGGPHTARTTGALLDRATAVRVPALNAGLVVAVLPLPFPVRLAGAAAVLATLVTAGALIGRAVLVGRRLRREPAFRRGVRDTGGHGV
jgi:nitrite reductase (NO-forming)